MFSHEGSDDEGIKIDASLKYQKFEGSLSKEGANIFAIDRPTIEGDDLDNLYQNTNCEAIVFFNQSNRQVSGNLMPIQSPKSIGNMESFLNNSSGMRPISKKVGDGQFVMKFTNYQSKQS